LNWDKLHRFVTAAVTVCIGLAMMM